MLYQITSKSFLFASDSTHEYGDEMPTHETACCITIAFLGNQKKKEKKEQQIDAELFPNINYCYELNKKYILTKNKGEFKKLDFD